MGKALYLRGWLFIRSFVRRHAGDSSDVTLAFEDAQVIQPFSREETDNNHIEQYIVKPCKKWEV